MEWYIGMDLGGTKCAAGIVDSEGRLLARDSIRTGAHRPARDILDDMAAQAMRLAASLGADRAKLRGIGIGSPGTPDNRRGVVLYSSNLPFRADTAIREALMARTGMPVHLENDAACAALGEARVGAARGMADAVTLTLGTGVGCGMVLGGRIYHGFNNAAGEFGHTVLVPGGEPCPCGRRGCFEQYASATALIRETRRAMARRPSSLLHRFAREEGKVSARTAFVAMRAGDAAAQAVVSDYIRMLSEGVTNLVNILMPSILLVGGGVSNEGESLLEPVRAYVEEHAYYGENVPHTRIALAALGNEAGIIGAALMAAESDAE
jgi:glucokinase